jgi:hypothetical protein
MNKLRIHLGCGTIIAPGYLNVDGDFPFIPKPLEEDKPYVIDEATRTYILKYDLRKGIPAMDNSVDVIYHSHFFEHLTRDEGRAFLKDCFRCLKPDSGIMRIVVPDFRLWCENYVANKVEFFEWYRLTYLGFGDPRYKTTGQIFAGMLYNWGHRMCFDFDSLCATLIDFDFSEIKRCQWGVSAGIPNVHILENDNPRQVESLLIECRKNERPTS